MPYVKGKNPLNDRLLACYTARDYAGMAQAMADGADPDMSVDGQRRILYRAVEQKDERAADLLLNYGASADACGDGKNPFLKSLRNDHYSMTRLLLDAGATFHVSQDMRGDCLTASRTSIYPRESTIDMLEPYRYELAARIDPEKDPETLKERLLQPNHYGFAPLDNREMWKKFNHIGQVLLDHDTPLTKEDFLTPNAQGERLIDIAVRYRKFDLVANHLHQQGDSLSLHDLLQADNAPTPLFDHIAAKGGAKALFTTRQMQGKNAQDIRRLYHALPGEARPQITNYHSLVSQARNQQAHQGSSR